MALREDDGAVVTDSTNMARILANYYASWPSNFSKEKSTLTRLNSSSAHPEPVYEGTPTDYCKDQAVLDAEAVPSLWNSGTDFQHT